MTWDKLWTDEKKIQRWLTPDPQVVEVSRELRGRGFRRAFDLGRGVGRHVNSLTKEGSEVHASDSSETAVRYCQQWLQREGLSATVRRMDMSEIPYPDSFFDLIVAYNVIYHATFAGMRRVVQMLHRKLRPGGYLFATLKSPEEWTYGRGSRIERNTFIQKSKSVPIHFSTEDEIEALFGQFDLVSKQHWSRINETSQKRHASWKITLRKPGEMPSLLPLESVMGVGHERS